MPLATSDFVGILDSMREGFQVIDHEMRYVHLNAAAAGHGRTTSDALVGRTMTECFPGIEATAMYRLVEQCLAEGTTHVLDNEFVCGDGSSGYFELHIQPVPQGACVLSIDITARRLAERGRAEAEAEATLTHAQRLDAVGQLAAGVAHDFNNLLTIMLTQGELSLRRADGPTREQMGVIIDAARTASALTRQLLAFGQRTIMKRELIDLPAMLRGLERLLRSSLTSAISLELRTGVTDCIVEADRSQLEQIVMNLVLNARDAITDNGRITIDLEAVDVDEAKARQLAEVSPGKHLVLSVTDTGAGMDAATQARIFEPFFTTKEQGRGSGLGLATVYGIVKEHDGDIWVYSEAGRGTTIKVYLPVAHHQTLVIRTTVAPDPAGEASTVPAPCVPAPPAVAPVAPVATVLVADDAPLLRKLISSALLAAGFHVIVAASGAEAIALWDRQHGEIDLLITDVVMPGLSGPELIAKLRTRRPSLPVICTSGYASSYLVDRGAMPDGVAFVEKPFAPSVLVERVRALLRGAAAT